MRDTRRLNTVTVTEFNELVGIIGSGDRAMIIYLGENNQDTFFKWNHRVGSFYDPDIKLLIAKDQITQGLSICHSIGETPDNTKNIVFAFKKIEEQLECLDQLLDGKARNTNAGNSIAKLYVSNIKKIIGNVLGSS